MWEHTVFNRLLEEFKTCTRLQYSGKLEIKSAKGDNWTFYYWLGRIVWATGGTHPLRRWRRLMTQHCPQIDVDNIQLCSQDMSIDSWDYTSLKILHEQHKIQREQIKAFVESAIAELLFDIAQQANFGSVTCDRNSQVVLYSPISFTSTDPILKQTQDSWHIWTEAGLAHLSPNQAFVLRQPEQLQQRVTPNVYKNCVKYMNGKYTLRDIAMKTKQSVLPIASSLLPYILKGIIELVEIPDLPLQISVKKHTTPLIACVDDSPLICQTIGKIVTANGMRFIDVQNPVKILTTLIENKPDLIFLDLIMPVANGYEICSQLRRISDFTNTPVVILTASESLFDRMRAKVVNATDFLTKPVITEQVLTVARKYLQRQTLQQLSLV